MDSRRLFSGDSPLSRVHPGILVAGVFLLALINNGFNILNADPFFRDLTTGLVILAAIGISAIGQSNR